MRDAWEALFYITGLCEVFLYYNEGRVGTKSLGSIHVQDAQGTCGGGTIGLEHLAFIAGRDDASLIEVVLPFAFCARSYALTIHCQRIALQGQGVGIETVGTHKVVGIERGSARGHVGHGAEAHDDAVVPPQMFLALQLHIYGIEAFLRRCLLIVAEHKEGGAAPRPAAYGAEDAGSSHVHGAGERSVLMGFVVDGQVAVEIGIGVSVVAASRQCEHHQCREKVCQQFFHSFVFG